MNKSAPCWWGLYVYMNFLLPEEMFLKRAEIIISSQHQHTFPSNCHARKVQSSHLISKICVFVWWWWCGLWLVVAIYLCNVWWCYLIVLIFYLIISAFVLHACKIRVRREDLIIRIKNTIALSGSVLHHVHFGVWRPPHFSCCGVGGGQWQQEWWIIMSDPILQARSIKLSIWQPVK